ncbi:MAG TPA: CpaF family protein, partial [Rhizobiales bacterium]|nr:CpaF family protein [Hyphomicrobiales bacterium]
MFGKRGGTPGEPQSGLEPPAAPGALPDANAIPAAGDAAVIPDLPLNDGSGVGTAAAPEAPAAPQANLPVEPVAHKPQAADQQRSEEYYDIKTTIFNALIDAIDLTQLGQLDADSARDEIRDIVNEIITLKDVVMSIAEQEELLEDICNDVLGYGPLEPLLARDDIADIMINGAGLTFIEADGKMEQTGIRFRDNAQLLNIAQRIVSQIGRRVDEASPICDARLP